MVLGNSTTPTYRRFSERKVTEWAVKESLKTNPQQPALDGEQFELDPDEEELVDSESEAQDEEEVVQEEEGDAHLDGCCCDWVDPPSWSSEKGSVPVYLEEILKQEEVGAAPVRHERNFHKSSGVKKRKSPSTLAGDAKRSHARRAGCSVHEAEGELASSVKPQTTFYAAKNTVTVTQEQVKAGSVTPRQMELAKACREAEWIPYNPFGFEAKLGDHVVLYYGPTSARHVRDGYRKVTACLTCIFHNDRGDGRTKRGVEHPHTCGEHSQQRKRPSFWRRGRKYQEVVAKVMRDICDQNMNRIHAKWPGQRRLRRPNALYGAADLICVNAPPVKSICKTCKKPKRTGAAQTHMHVDSENDVCRVCGVTYSGRYETMSCGLFIPELGLILELPPGVTVFYGSSLWIHGNVNLADHLTEEEILAKTGRRYNKKMAAADAKVAVRWSIVHFNQGSTRRADISAGEWWTINRPDFAPSLLDRRDPGRKAGLLAFFNECWTSGTDMSKDQRDCLIAEAEAIEAEAERRK